MPTKNALEQFQARGESIKMALRTSGFEEKQLDGTRRNARWWGGEALGKINLCWLQLQARCVVCAQLLGRSRAAFLELRAPDDLLQLPHDSRFGGGLGYPAGIRCSLRSHHQLELVATLAGETRIIAL